VLQALAQPSPASALIQIRDLDTFVPREVPRLSEELTGQAQEPFNKVAGNFPIGASRPGAGPKPPAASECQTGRYILLGSAVVPVRAKPEDNAEINVTLRGVDGGAGMRIPWHLDADRKDTKLGYVSADAARRIKE
jgi:hypothetical protein